FRIELAEIEACLNQHPAIREAAAVIQSVSQPTSPTSQSTNEPQIVAYVVWSAGSSLAPTELSAVASVESLRRFLQSHLPSYMLPARFVQLEALPRLPNGKLDRKALPVPDQFLASAYAAPETPLEQTIATLWQQELGIERVGRQDNFFELGGHSLLGMTVMAHLREILQTDIPLRYLFQAPTVAELATFIESSASPSPGMSLPSLTTDPDHRYQPFPLTDIQHAYWIGRNEAFELGNIATHGYREIETVGLTVAQVEQALQQLIARHEMLRVIVQPDGRQRILAEVDPYRIQTIDLRRQHPDSVAAQLAALRQRLSHQVLSTETYPLFDIQAAILDDQTIRFYVSFDVLIGDAWSVQLLGQELMQLLQNPAALLPPLTLSFRDYVLAEQQWRNSATYQQAERYWQQRLPNLPPAPELPLAQNPAAIAAPQFVRRSGELSPALWQQLQQTAAHLNLTPSSVLLAAFADVLSRWSRQPAFTLNLTLFNRLPLHPEVNRIVGDFTSSLLLGIDPGQSASFAERAQRIQAQLWQDLDHRYVSGVKVLRLLSRRQQRTSGALMPVVFTSILHHAFPDASRTQTYQHQVVYSLSQTSQVYFDHQVAEVAGRLVFNWDTIDDLFPPGLLNDMFAAYTHLLEQLAYYPDRWHSYSLLPPAPLAPASSSASLSIPLHDLFFQAAARHPDRPAVLTSSLCFTYHELEKQVNQLASILANELANHSVNKSASESKHESEHSLTPRIAIVMEKSWEQIVAVLATLTVGAAYVPIDPALPTERRQSLLSQTEPRLILSQPHLTALLPDHLPHLTLPLPPSTPSSPLLYSSTPHSLAYILYTSGSTGQPKGVMIDHAAAVNTILDINQRFQITATDRVFGLSSLSFDLSVYDIFGTLAAGAALVLPDADKVHDPLHWKTLLAQHSVTIWNSVPALMQLGLSALPNTLRLVLLSGDWIPLSLPAQIWQRCPAVELISLGGATEAAIWSIYYPITQVDPSWKSIPYGWPLHNQQVYVLNLALERCPTWVTGELYIGGAGLAQGYWNDDAKTNARFIQHPQTGERLYKTGDLGRYLPDGAIEFLGRDDFQVKINGQRIELGEIEACLQQHPLIRAAVVTVSGTSPRQQLVAYVVPETNTKVDIQLQQRRLRTDTDSVSIKIDLPDASDPASFLRRQTHRQFLSSPVSLMALGHWLSGLRQLSLPDAPLPKYRYASAGSLYPVQTYLYVKPDRVPGLTGLYYYYPVEHQLMLLDAKLTIDAALYGSNQAIFEQASFALFLIAALDTITPVYGDQARDFCLLEAGYMSQLLMETATDYDIGVCPIGRMDFALIEEHFQLASNQPLLHSFVGGAIDPVWTKQTAPQPSQSIPEQLQQYLQQRLPDYMVPTTYRLLDALPLTANGKVDRKALPAIQPVEQPFVAPQTAVEQQIAAIWQQVLNLEAIGIHDNFFDRGGNSLSATQALTQMRQQFQSDLSIRQFFTTPTIAELAQTLSSSPPAAEESISIKRASVYRDAYQDIDRDNHFDISLSNIDQLSDQDVDALLQQMLTEEAEP
ncbi:MAG: amino acid adenylation domain-containing protein, partial [Synechococcales cyanobacterium M58_A2018_015]|nr:amino acid adenylation domain-containing protein [Synechococcales cyanobacterium M58_A2018_015]